MQVEFKIDGATLRVVTSPEKYPTQISFTIQRPDSSIHLYLPQSMGRALASALMGAAAELRPPKE